MTPVHKVLQYARDDHYRRNMFTFDNMCLRLMSIWKARDVETDESIGQRIEQIRRRANVSQSDFADALGISRTTLHNYVRGERALTEPVLAKLLEVYNADPLWVLDGDAGLQSRQQSTLAALGDILERVEQRLVERGERLGTRKRWMIVCRLYADLIAAERRDGSKPTLDELGLDNLLEVAQ